MAGISLPDGLKGVTDGSDAASGNIGQYAESTVTTGTLNADGTYNAATSLSLGAGDWDVSGRCVYVQVGTTVNAIELVVNTTSGANTGSTLGRDRFQGLGTTLGGGVTGNGDNVSLSAPNVRFSVSSSTTVYLNIQATGGGTFNGRVCLSARRIR
jgi:hypothetical protein